MVAISKRCPSSGQILVCDRTDPPGCCRYVTLAEWQQQYDDRSRRVDAALARAEASRPKTCPSCGSSDLVPHFSSRSWECWTCWLVFEPEGDHHAATQALAARGGEGAG